VEDAAARSRRSARVRAGRLIEAGRSVGQIAVAATLAWLFALEVLGNPEPFFAPVAAIVTLSVTYGQRGRRAVELGLGVAAGILVGDLIVLAIGTGTLQLGLVVLIAVSLAILLGTGPLIVNQAGISAALVVTIQAPDGTFAFDRFQDALTGSTIALGISAVLFPTNPIVLLRRAAGPVLEELAATLEDVAQALLERDQGAAERALLRARAIDATAVHEAVEVGRETTRLVQLRRRARPHVDRYADAATQIELAIRDVVVLARGGVRAIQLADSVPREIADALRNLAAAVRALDALLEGPEGEADVRAPAVRAAGSATLVLEGTQNLSVTAIVAQIRSTAVDLLRGSGLERETAQEAVRQAARRQAAEG